MLFSRIFFTTSYLINRFAFPWVPAEFIHPSNIENNWTPEKGEIDQKTTVIVLQIDRSRRVYEDDGGDLDEELGLAADSKIVVVEFGSRGGAAARWANKLRESQNNVVQLTVAGEVVKETPEALEKFKARAKTGATVFNASAARVQDVNILGEKRYSDELLTEWLAFKIRGLVQVLELVWGVGMEAMGKGWEKLCKGEVKSDQGLVFYLERSCDPHIEMSNPLNIWS
ncbi:hypothetical protein DL98DRAFT_579062 [Cadophora sp. DSE1049]|nr:hypothetical protein DL98DRAFT_579062 [Cadophora sp. DSE1049]